MSSAPLNRRAFLHAGAAATAFAILPGRIRGATRQGSPNEKLNIAAIGVGQQGRHNPRNLECENIVALCDVDLDYAAKGIERYPQAKVYTDYRVMLEKQKDIDAVLIATPDHTHAVIAMAAIRADAWIFHSVALGEEGSDLTYSRPAPSESPGQHDGAIGMVGGAAR